MYIKQNNKHKEIEHDRFGPLTPLILTFKVLFGWVGLDRYASKG